jgi:hypothetical protein
MLNLELAYCGKDFGRITDLEVEQDGYPNVVSIEIEKYLIKKCLGKE